MNIAIRLAVPADAPDMAEVLIHSWETAYKDIVPAEYIKEKNATRQAQFQKNITDENTTHYVIQRDGKTIGIMTLVPEENDDTAYDLQAIYLHPDCFRQGIGSVAVNFAFEKARNLGKTIMNVWVLAENTNSIKFYEKCGFAADGKTRIWNYGKPLTGIRMRREL